MAENWKVYTLGVEDDQPATCMVDIEWMDKAPDADRPVCHLVRIPFNNAGENGFGDQDERDAMNALEDQAFSRITAETGAALVASVRGGGRLDHWLYASSEAGDRIAEIVAECLDGYEIQTAAQEDPEWNQYLNVLLPDEVGWQEIGNQDVVSSLAESGDPLDIPRPVEHLAYFPTEPDARAFSEAITPEGFETTGIEQGDADMAESEGEAPPWLVDFKRDDPVTLPEINAITGWLVQLAAEHNGGYDGWQAEIRDSEGRPPDQWPEKQ